MSSEAAGSEGSSALTRSKATLILLGCLTAALAAGLTAPADEPAPPAPEKKAEPAAPKGPATSPEKAEPPALPLAKAPYVITIHGNIDAGLLYAVKRRCERAIEAGADLILFDVDTYGGLLDEALQMADYVANLKGPVTVAYVSRKALSAGALFSVACDHIVMGRNTTLGDCAPIIPSKEGGFDVAGEKIQSPLRAAFATYARDNHIPVVLAQAMVTMEWEVLRISRLKDADDWGDQEFIRKADFDELPDEKKKEILKKQVVCRKGELLTLGDERAVAYGFARRRAGDLQEALAPYVQEGVQAVKLGTTWSEEMVRWLNNSAVAGLILLIGLMAFYIALKTPGTGAPEAVAAVCFAVFFGSKFLVGLADALDVALVVVGVALLLVEVLVIPGFGVTGIAGIVLMVAGLVLMGQKFGLPRVPGEVDFFVKNLLTVFLALLFSLVGFFVLLRLAPGLPVLRRLVLTAAQTADGAHVGAQVALRDLVGHTGVALTHLRPAGRAEVGDEILDVVSEGEYVNAGEKIEIIQVRGHRVVVRRA